MEKKGNVLNPNKVTYEELSVNDIVLTQSRSEKTGVGVIDEKGENAGGKFVRVKFGYDRRTCMVYLEDYLKEPDGSHAVMNELAILEILGNTESKRVKPQQVYVISCLSEDETGEGAVESVCSEAYDNFDDAAEACDKVLKAEYEDWISAGYKKSEIYFDECKGEISYVNYTKFFRARVKVVSIYPKHN